MTLLEHEPGESMPPSVRTSRTSRTRQGVQRADGVEPPRPRVQARTPLTEKSLLKRGGLKSGSADAAAATRLMGMQREASRARAHLLRTVADFWVDRGDPDLVDDREEADLAIAIALRTTTSRAATLLRDAHIAVDEMPLVFGRLAAGDMPAEWFDRLLRSVRELTAFQRGEVDERVSAWDLASIPAPRFQESLRLLLAWFDADGGRPRPEDMRDVALERSPQDDGTACLRITGPLHEILGLARRLDTSARAVQAQQRHALEDGSPVPFDLDGDTAAAGSAMSLAAIRYALITRTMLDTAGVEVPRERHRINVVVPVLTLMGLDDAPATYDGVIPLPADMARRLAAGEEVWHRVLTDPTTGEFLPLPADQYRPTAAMVEHLRLRDPVCAAPGCTRTTSSDAENDHIEEFDHSDPQRGGPTSIENLHRLHWAHHDAKTKGRTDPVRNPDGSTTWTVGTPTRAEVTIAPRTDLVTPIIAAALADSWAQYEWTLELDALERMGEFERFEREAGPYDPALDIGYGVEPVWGTPPCNARYDADPPF
ncbi:HNH endonuclease [Brachybacterium alimentarium]|uniref:HNH endonuclease n=1 Tax=Brachybacterium alimentarium TaxID=47845 RepID=UPI003FD0669B